MLSYCIYIIYYASYLIHISYMVYNILKIIYGLLDITYYILLMQTDFVSPMNLRYYNTNTYWEIQLMRIHLGS